MARVAAGASDCVSRSPVGIVTALQSPRESARGISRRSHAGASPSPGRSLSHTASCVPCGPLSDVGDGVANADAATSLVPPRQFVQFVLNPPHDVRNPPCFHWLRPAAYVAIHNLCRFDMLPSGPGRRTPPAIVSRPVVNYPSYDHRPAIIPVLPAEVLHWLDPQPGQVIVDCTVGGRRPCAA